MSNDEKREAITIIEQLSDEYFDLFLSFMAVEFPEIFLPLWEGAHHE